jgi:predicted MPP superfamily phosphohydrolase
MNRRKFMKLSLWSGLGTLICSYPIFIERYIILVNTYKISVSNLPIEFNGFRILHLTDLHLGFLVPDSFINYVINKANSLEKDIIVCTGDYIHEKNNVDHIDRVWPMLTKLQAKFGVYNVLGNHDHWGDFERSLYWLKKSGQNVRHSAKSIEINGKRIWIGGAGDLWEDELGIDKAFTNVPENDCKILLAHNPDTADENIETHVDLIISGHTHGGQVNIPFYGTPILPVRNKEYSSGLIRTKTVNMFISKGIGWAVYPIRFNCYPEIAILELQKRGEVIS